MRNEKPGPDPRDVKILEYLRINPTATSDEVSRQTEIPKSTVERRITHLLDEKALHRGYTVELAYVGYVHRYRIDVQINPRELRLNEGGRPEKGQKINSQRGLAHYIMDNLAKEPRFRERLIVEDVRILLGQPADLSVTVRAKDPKVILEFVTDGLRALGGVSNTSTSQEAWSCLEGTL